MWIYMESQLEYALNAFAALLLCIENGVKEDCCMMGCDALYFGRQL
jgi:hypothetical protein